MWTSVEELSQESHDLICTVCPLGCQITARRGSAPVQLAGNACARGEEYARQEVTDPRRIVTSTVNILNGIIRRLPVRSSVPVPKHLIPELMQVINALEVSAPIERGAVVARNLLTHEIDLLATRTVPARSREKG